MKILITEDQLKTIAIPFYKEKKEGSDDEISIFRENWLQLNEEEKKLTLELYKFLYPKKSQQLNEGAMDWIQGGLDVVGIFDPTGIADLTNAVLYFGRGEVLFGMLSLVSLLPYVGDAVAKPIIIGGKLLGAPFKAFKAAVLTKDATKIARSAKAMEKTGPVGKKIVEFIEGFNKGIGDKIKNLLAKGNKIPIVRKFTRTIEGWIDVFKNAGKQINLPTKATKFEIPVGLAGAWKGTVKGSEKVDFLKSLKQMMNFKGSPTVFREMAKKGKFTFLGKEFTKFWQVPKHRKLLGRTKLYLRFLDSMGMANFIGPDELIAEYPEADDKFAQYVDSPEGQAAFNEEFINSPDIENYYSGTPSESPVSDVTSTPTDSMMQKLLSSLGISPDDVSSETKTILLQYLKSMA